MIGMLIFVAIVITDKYYESNKSRENITKKS